MKRLQSAALLTIALCGCQAAPESSTLDAPIPDCAELISDKRKAYLQQAEAECAKANTMDDRANSVGCEVVRRHAGCIAKGMFKFQ